MLDTYEEEQRRHPGPFFALWLLSGTCHLEKELLRTDADIFYFLRER